jgi:hypothetical protein
LQYGDISAAFNTDFAIIRFDVENMIVSSVFYADIYGTNVTVGSTKEVMSSVQQVVVINNIAYVYSGPDSANLLLAVTLDLQPTAFPSSAPLTGTASPVPSQQGPSFDPTASPVLLSPAPAPTGGSASTPNPTPDTTRVPSSAPTAGLPFISSLDPTSSPTPPVFSVVPTTVTTTFPTAAPTSSGTGLSPPPPPPPTSRKLWNAFSQSVNGNAEVTEFSTLRIAVDRTAPVGRRSLSGKVLQPAVYLTQFFSSPDTDAYITLTDIVNEYTTGGPYIYLYGDSDHTREIYDPQMATVEYLSPYGTQIYPTSVEIGYYYAICDGNAGNYSLSSSLLTDFSAVCDATNGYETYSPANCCCLICRK